MRLPNASEAVMMTLTVTSAACAPRHPPTARVITLFGPATGNETISGRVEDPQGRTVLMAGGSALVTIDPESRAQEKTRLLLGTRERCWGLARLADGSLWTLSGRNAAVQIGPRGDIVRELPLAEPQLGIFAAADRLVFQPARQVVDAPLLLAGRPDGGIRDPWSTLRVRPFARLASGAAAALNLVACGTSRRAEEVPCWFPYEAAIWSIAPDGKTTRIQLEGLADADPAALINASAPDRPVRDALIEADGTIWVISTGTPPPGAKDLPGGWLLARFGPHGDAIDRRVLPESARVILRAGHGRVLVLTGAGMVAEVAP